MGKADSDRMVENQYHEGKNGKAYLLKLSDALRPLAEPNEIQAEAMRVLGEHLGAVRAQYWEAEPDGEHLRSESGYAKEGPCISGRIQPNDFDVHVIEAFAAGRTLAIADVAADSLASEAVLAAYDAAGVCAFIGVPLVKSGRLVALLGVHRAEAQEWTKAEIALAEETAERTWAAVERARSEAARHEAEQCYMALFNAIEQGFCTIEVLFDGDERPVDYRFLEVSPSFERQTGIKDGAGRRMREIAPDQDQFWFDTYGRVARTGEPIRFESFSTPLDRWWSVYAFKIDGPARIAVLFHDITEQKRAETALSESEEQFESVLNQAPLGVYLVDGNFMVRQVNPVALPVFGDIPGGPVGRDFGEVIHILWDKEYADEIVRIFRHTLETGEPYVTPERAEYRVDRDITEYYEWRLDRILLPGGQYGVVCYFRDISAQVQARKEIEDGREFARETEERQTFLLKLSDALQLLTDPEAIHSTAMNLLGEHLGVNRAAYFYLVNPGVNDTMTAVSMYTQGVVPWPAQISLADFGAALGSSNAAGVTSVITDVETDENLVDGRSAWAEMQIRAAVGVPVFEKGKYVAAIVIHSSVPRRWTAAEIALIEDVAARIWVVVDRARAEDALRESEEQFRALSDVIPALTWRNDAEGNNLFVNRYFMEFMGASAEEIRDTGWHNILHPDDAERYIAAYLADVQAHRPHRGYGRYRRHDGEWRNHEYQTEPIFAANGAYMGDVGVALDVTERRRAEEAVAASEEKYRTLFESIDEGVTTFEVIFDDNGRVVDGIYIENNSAFGRLTGQTDDVIGKRLTDVLPNLESFWLETYGRVVATGESERVEYIVDGFDKNWFDVHISRVGGTDSRTLVGVYTNITTRKRREANLAFLAEVSKDLVAVRNIGDTMNALGAKIGEYFGATRLGFFEFNEAADEVVCEYAWHAKADDIGIVGNYRTADFYTDADEFILTLRAGEAFVLADGTADGRVVPENFAALNIRSLIVVPTDRDSRLPLGVLALNDNKARVWREDEIDLMRELTTRIWTSLERARAEDKLVVSEAKYRTLFNSTDQAFAIVEVVQDAHGTVIDCLYLEVNSAYDRQIGFGDVEGKMISKVFPQQESYWMEQFDRVIQTGEPIRFENYSVDTGRWYQANYTRVGGADSRLVGIVFDEITGRKRSEANLAFLAEVSTDLVSLMTIDETMEALGAKIGTYFEASMCSFVEIDAERGMGVVTHAWHAEDAVSLVGEYRIADYGTAEQLASWRSGKPFIVMDAKSDERVNAEALAPLGIGSYITMPIARNGEWQYILTVYDRVAHDWREDEIDLMRELTTRIWTRLERARAEDNLRESEEKFRTLFETMAEGFALCEGIRNETGKLVDYRVLMLNPAHERLTGLKREDTEGKRALEIVPDMEDWWFETFQKVLDTGETISFERHLESFDQWYEVTAFRYTNKTFAYLYNDVTERKRQEMNLAFLADVTADLVSLTNIDEVMNALAARIGKHFSVAGVVFSEISEDGDTLTVKHDWHRSDFPELKGIHKVKDYLSPEFEALHRAGGLAIVNDTSKDERVDAESYAARGIGAFVGVPLIRQGSWQFLFALLSPTARDWRGDETELMRELITRIWTRLERARAEDKLAASEVKYRTLFESIDEGFCLLEILFDESGEAHDYVFLEANAAFERQSGLVGAVGRSVLELVPGLEAQWVKLYAQVAKTGEPIRFEADVAAMARIFDIYAFSGGENKVAVVFNDITERMRREANLSFLADASRELVALTNIGDTMDAMGAKIGAYFGATRVAFFEFNEATDEAVCEYAWHAKADDISLVGNFRTADFYTDADEFVSTLRAGEAFVLADGTADGRVMPESLTALDIRSFIVIPANRDKRLPLSALALNDNKARVWREDEIDLMRELTTRIWTRLERARAEEALAESEERTRAIVENVSEYAIIPTDATGIITGWNMGAEKIFGYAKDEVIGCSFAVIFTPEDREAGIPEREMSTAATEGSAFDERYHLRKDGVRIFVSGTLSLLPLGSAAGFVKIVRDMTEQIAAGKVRQNAETLRTLVRGQEQERKRLARDLHDELGQQLTALRMKLDMLHRSDGVPNPPLDEIIGMAESIDEGVDRLAWDLRPAVLDDLGLYSALDRFVREWSRHTKIRAELINSNLHGVRLTFEVETNLYRIAQEALNNVHKHSRAENVAVMLHKRADSIMMMIEDDGKGFDPAEKSNGAGGLGLTGMRERAVLIDGDFEVDSAPGKGATVYLRVPLTAIRSEDEE